jgi:xanthine dehydrogenase accessory factor
MSMYSRLPLRCPTGGNLRFSTMRFLWPALQPWIDSGERFALATIVATEGSAQRVPGACMAIAGDGLRFLGSVSAGCLEAEVVEAARAAIDTGAVRRLAFGPDSDPPWSGGGTCGGRVEVRVERWWGCEDRREIRDVGAVVRRWLERDVPGVLLSCGPRHVAIDSVGSRSGWAEGVGEEVLAAGLRHLSAELPPVERQIGGEGVFIRTIRRRPRLLIAGAGDVGISLVVLGREAGFSTIMVDPRQAFLASDRFRQPADITRRAWPHHVVRELELGSRDAAVVLSHDAKIDDPALCALLETRVGYIGAMGGRRSHDLRRERLRALAIDESALSRINGPAGLHLGTPDARGIALGILAGIVQWQAADEQRRRAIALGREVA